jgi:hypothetical protein
MPQRGSSPLKRKGKSNPGTRRGAPAPNFQLHPGPSPRNLRASMNTPRFLSVTLTAWLIGACLAVTAFAQTPSDKPTVQGTFLGDGKDAKLQYLVVQTREPFSDKPAIRLVFTEKNPAASKKPDFDAGFKKLGSALILSVFKDGGIFGCEVAHAAHPKSPFTDLGRIKMTEFNVTETHVTGKVSTGGEVDMFGQKWSVDLTFSAPLPKGAFAEAATAPKSDEKSKEETIPAVAAGPKLPIAELPLPTGAVDVEYKQVVEHIVFRADSSVSAVTADFSKKLKAQGWKDGAGSLAGKTNAILKRTRDGAALTIMIQPAGAGCNVKVFTEGLDWSEVPASASTKPAAQPAAGAPAEDPEAKAQRLIQDALRQIPGAR